MGDLVIAIITEEPDTPVRMAELIDRAQKMVNDVPGVRIKMTRGDAAATIRFFAENGELPTDNVAPDGSLGTQTFKKKPVQIQAVQLSWKTWHDVCDFLGDAIGEHNPGYNISLEEVSDTCGEEGPEYIALRVTTIHGEIATVRHGDWIIPDSKPGTFYPCKPNVFAATYFTVTKELT